MIPILFLFANPDNADTLLAGDELRQIEAALKGSRFEVIAKPAARLEDLPELLRQSKAAIVHFSGHGSRYGKLMFVNEQGESQSAPISALANLFKLFKYQVRCVVLNACYSDEQAAAIAEQVECVLGFEGAIRDDAARAFASGFYGALAAGENLIRAKEFGLNEIERRYSDALLPCHLVGQGDAKTLRPLDWNDADNEQSILQIQNINTDGGTSIGRDVHTGGDFVNRDKIEHHVHYHGIDSLATRHSPPAIRGIFGQYPFNQHFFGRDDELAQLHTLLQTQNTVSICPVITGMGGLGKTQLAAHYARRHEADYPDGIFWVTAADLNAIRGQLADFCVSLGLPVADPQRTGDLSEQKITAFKHYLDEHPKALLIFDNVEEPDHLRTRQIGVQMTALTLGGKLIVTTRRRKLSSDRFVELPLQRLLPEPARQILLTARADLAYDPDLNRLCEQFGYLPLMLNLAAAALRKRGGAIAGYLQRLHTLGAERLHNDVAKVSLDDYHKSLSAVLQEQWAMLQDENARLVFRVAGQLPEAEVIPNARLGLLSGLQDVDEWERPLSDALEELERASLIERVEGTSIRLHPLVSEFAEGLTPASEHDDLRTQCAQRLADAYATTEIGLRRLGNEYAARGIAAILIDLITAIDFAQSATTNNQSLVSNLQSLLRLLRLEANKLQHTACLPEQLWQQLLLHTPLAADTGLKEKLDGLLQHTLHGLPQWEHQRNSLALEQTLSGHEYAVTSVAVIDAQHIVSTSDDRTLKVWNLESGEVEQTLAGHTEDVLGVAVVDAQRIVSTSLDRDLKVWNLATGAMELTLRGHGKIVSDMAVIDAQRIVSASLDGDLKVWNLATGAMELTLRGHKGWVLGVAVIDAQRIVSSSTDHTLKVWNVEDGAVVQTMSGHEATVNSVAVIDAQHIVSAAADGILKVWNLKTGSVEQTLRGHKASVLGVAVIDAKRIVSAADDGILKVWNLETGAEEQTLRSHEARVYRVAVIDAQHIVSASADRTLKVWNLKTASSSTRDSLHRVAQTLRGHEAMVNSVAVIDAQHIVSASADCTLKVWNLATGALAQTLNEHKDSVYSVTVLDTHRIVSASLDGTLKLWNLETGAVEQTLRSHVATVFGVTMLDAQPIVFGADDRTLKVWNLQTGAVKQTLRGHEKIVLTMAVIDAQRIVSTSADRALKVWNLESGAVEQTLRGHENNVLGVAVIDSKRIVSASTDRTLKVWNLESGAVEQTLSGHEASVLGVAVIDAADGFGRRIVSASSDRTLKVWNIETGKVIASIGLDGAPQCVAVTRHEGRTLVVAGDAAGALYCLELVEPKGGQGDKVKG